MTGDGYIFVIHGDLTKLASDAWMVSTDEFFNLTNWRRSLPTQWEKPPRWPTDCGGLLRVDTGPGETRPWLANVAGTANASIKHCVDIAVRFVEQAGKDCRRRKNDELMLGHRQRPLLTLPLIGTGRGGQYPAAGSVAAKLLPALQEAANKTGVDVALVLHEETAYSACLAARRNLPACILPGAEEQACLERLTKLASEHRLVLFIGAGVSVGAGLPTWEGLLNDIAKELGHDFVGEDRSEWLKVAPADRARLLQQLQHLKNVPGNKDGPSLRRAVARRIKGKERYSLSHALLARLPVNQVVTTNYDRLFEKACLAAGRPAVTLPYERATGQRWVLKLHGDVEYEEDIVITRSDYIGYHETRAALRGIVQAMLVTHHMLFVGFSLSDENFHQIAHDVRKAIRNPVGDEAATDQCLERFGTCLWLARGRLAEQLWSKELWWMNFSPLRAPNLNDLDGPAELATAARRLEIFLDHLADRTFGAPTHLLDARYSELVATQADKEMKTLLLELEEKVKNLKDSSVYRKVESLLASLRGGSDEG